MRRLQNRSLLEVNEDFGGKRNDKRAFLVILIKGIHRIPSIYISEAELTLINKQIEETYDIRKPTAQRA